MTHLEYHWETRDGLDILARAWMPARRHLNGVVAVLHGLGEHSGRWEHVGEALAEAGYGVVVPDLRGHGKSGGPRGHAPSYEALLDDVALLLDKGRELADAPLFLYGHSMGGNLALNYVLRRRPVLAGVVVSSPWLELAMPVPAWKTHLGKLLRGALPSLTMPNGLNPANLSRDAQVGQAYGADLLVHERISAGLGMDIHESGAWALEHAGEFARPVLVMHGLSDRITSPDASRRFAAQVANDCTFREWEGLYHEIHNEPEKDEVLGAVVAWLQAHWGVA